MLRIASPPTSNNHESEISTHLFSWIYIICKLMIDPHMALKFADMKINKAQNKQMKMFYISDFDFDTLS